MTSDIRTPAFDSYNRSQLRYSHNKMDAVRNADNANNARRANGNGNGNNGLSHLSLTADPKFDGLRTCKVSAEDWLRAMKTKAAISAFTDRQAIDYSMRHLEGSAATYFYSYLRGTMPRLWKKIMEDFAEFGTVFGKAYFKELTTADAAIDWNNLKQTSHEDAVSFLYRVGAGINHFFDRTCGVLNVTEYTDSSTAPAFSYLAEDTEAATLEETAWDTAVLNGLEEAQGKDARLTGAACPPEATAAYTLFVANSRKNIKDAISNTKERVYLAVQNRLTSALILKTAHTGLKFQKCKDVVFQAMLKEEADLNAVARLLRSTEQEAEAMAAKASHNGRFARTHNGKGRINAVTTDDDDGQDIPDDSEEADERDSSTRAQMEAQQKSIQQLQDTVAALRSNGHNGSNGNGTGANGNGKFQGICKHCKRKGHKIADCKKKKREDKENSHKKSEN